MSFGGTAAYSADTQAPDLVRAAVANARSIDFELCVRPEIGRLLAVLAGGMVAGAVVGETGTGTGAGLAWMVAAARPDVRFVSYERDEERAALATELFAGHSTVEIICGDSAGLFGHGPFDLLVHDGGPYAGKSPGDERIDPGAVLAPGATMTIDDFSPMADWPPHFDGRPDEGRMHWLTHPEMRTTEITVAADLSVVVARYLPGLTARRDAG